MAVAGETQTAGPGGVAIAPSNAPHSVRAVTDGRALVVDNGIRDDRPK